ncbi:hypothetical protein [Hyalangium gracile]|uniref:hypothetical protein n=1 Tax=Hyalangium gracile TaxID=394092 RepID=UPI001CCBA371|nr:hypothetical protein [Hyalangium gracile]
MFWYRNVQFIAYSLDTKPGYGTGRYLALTNPTTDVTTRCAVMEAAARAARLRADSSSYCLKVFVAPEFFFRGHKGAYDLDTYQTVLTGLRAWASDSEWKHWIFVFGTVMATFDNESGGTEILNVALVHQGGAGVEGTRAIVKENLLEGDLLQLSQLTHASPVGALTFDNAVGVKTADQFLNATNRGDGAELQKWGFDGRGIFDMAGVRFGIEICADHLGGRLQLSPTAKGDWQPQLQVVTACGVQGLVAMNTVASTGGYIFLSDGFFEDGEGGRTSLSKVTTAKPSKEKSAVLQDIGVQTTVKMAGKLAGQWNQCFSQPGEVRLYPPQYIPWAKKA